jgi:ABC-type transport system substrate-binding protein
MSDIVDRESLTNQVLGSYGIPEKNISGQKDNLKPTQEIIDKLLQDESTGFSFKDGVLYTSTKKSSETNEDKNTANPVKLVLTTIQNKELEETAKFLQTSWKKIGLETEIRVVDRKDLNNIVKDRDFEGLLFGFSIKTEKDYYSFFSSKERSYPKLNISNYTSKQTDKILDVLSGENSDARVKDLVNQLSVEIADDNPVIILYKPQFVFAHFLKTQIKLPNTIRSEEDRYDYIEYWYTHTEKVLNIFQTSKVIDRLDTLLY